MITLKLLLAYWILVTIYGVYCSIKAESKHSNYISLGWLIGIITISIIFAWALVPMAIVDKIKIKIKN